MNRASLKLINYLSFNLQDIKQVHVVSTKLLRDQIRDIYTSIVERSGASCVVFSSSGLKEATRALLESTTAERCLVNIQPAFPETTFFEPAGSLSVDIMNGDLSALPIRESSLKLILYAFIIESIPEVKSVLAEARRVLREGGYIIVVEWTSSSRLRPEPGLSLEGHIDEFKKEFSQLYKVVDLRIFKDYFIVAGRKELSD